MRVKTKERIDSEIHLKTIHSRQSVFKLVILQEKCYLASK